QQQPAERIEVLRFAHPIDVGLFEELDHARFGFPSLDSKGFPFVPGAVGPQNAERSLYYNRRVLYPANRVLTGPSTA
ncbi:MAG TPA: hypothetical protein VH140_12580, partial [Candidatus Acidoferrum sp.]|nr:hypothetical protein [Candidatus Acidoferrum sp.]